MVARNVFLGILTAPELLFSLIVIATLVYCPQPFAFVGEKLTSDPESWKYIIVLPSALFAWCVKLFSDLRSPSDKQENKLLYDWPLYKLFVARLYLALTFSGLAAATAICLWLLGKHLDHRTIGALFVGATGVSLVVAATLTFAHARLKELLIQHGQ
jgi:hypothetical protein